MPGKVNKTSSVKSKISRLGLDALLVTNPADIRYFSGFYSCGNMLLIKKRGKAAYFVDSMNRTLALKKTNKKVTEVITADDLGRYFKEEGIKKVGFDSESISVSGYEKLRRKVPKVRFLSKKGKAPVSSVIKDARLVKTAGEVRLLREAAKETVSIWRKVKRDIRSGMSEKAIATMIDTEVRKRGFDNSFPTIAAIGENTAYPHAVPTQKRLKKGEHLLVDFGIRYQGYCSDLTRTYYKGRINRQIQPLRKIVLKARDFAINELRPGATIGSIVKRTYNIFEEEGFSQLVLHGLGHGVGLEIHEEPFLRMGRKDRLKTGMVVTVEPGLYKPGVGGVREEDMVLITRKGREVLTK